MAKIPPPEPSPEPELPRDSGEITGRFNMFELKIESEVASRTKAVEQSATWKMILSIVGAIGVLGGGFNAVMAQTDRKVKDAGDVIDEKLKSHEVRLNNNEAQTAALRSDVHETQADIRALYKATMSGQRQDRLEKPLPALATPDAGTSRPHR